MKSFILLSALLLTGAASMAQDSMRKREVTITSTFKPTLKEAAKINFNANPPSSDTTRPRLQYDIPNQNLAFAFQPGSLKPLALQVDTGARWDNESYVKLGYGSLNSPFAQAGVSFGDGRDAGLNIYAKHHGSKGKLPFQEYSSSNVDVTAFFKASKNLQWNVRFGGLQENYKRYGFQPRTLSFKDDSLDIKYQTWRGRVSFQNINRTEYGLSYAPEIKIDVFNDHIGNSESNSYVNLPLHKAIGNAFGIDLALAANLSRYKPDGTKAIVNNFYSFSPSVTYKNPNVSILAGVRPSWDNSSFMLLPNVLAEFNTADKRFAVQLGWTGYLKNAGYQYLAGQNPWIWAPANVYNTRIEERFGGFKGSVGDHLSYAAKIAYNIVNNQPLYVNDTMSGKSFLVINESRMRVYSASGELGYTVGEKFSVVTNLAINQYHLRDNVKAWGLLPLEWKTTLRLEVLKDLYVNSTLYAFDGPWSLSKSGRKNLPAAMDLNAGLEFRIVKNVKIWTQFNNIFNKEYQRWNQYPVYGFNFLGGVVFSFAQSK